MTEYDPRLKHLIDAATPDWVRWIQKRLNLPIGPYSVESPNLSTRADADRVFRFELPFPHLVDFELEAFWQKDRPRRYLKFSALLTEKTGLPVSTVAVVLTKKGYSKNLTGDYRLETPDGPYLQFRYRVLKVWEIPTAEFLNGGIGLLPLAPLTAKRDDLPEVIGNMAKRLVDEPPNVKQDTFAVAKGLMGMQFSSRVIEEVLSRATRMALDMRQSVVVQEWLEEGRAEGRVEGRAEANRESVLLLATDRFGAPTKSQKRKLENIGNAEHLSRILRQVPRATSWNDLLQVP